MLNANDSKKAVEAAVGAIEKQFGKGAIMRLGEKNPLLDKIESIPTGALSLDIALGLGGLPRGRIVEIYGPESSGKTTLMLHLVAEAQKRGGVAAFIDAEHALDTSYAKGIGVKLDDLLVSQPDTGEQALEIVDTLVRSNAVDVIVIDSVAALVPKAEIEGEMGDTHVGLQARLMSQALRKLTGNVARSKCIVVFINQIRMKIGVMFGNPETTTGGNALKFYSSVRMDIRRIASVKQADDVIGSRVKVKIVKNKVAAPFRAAEFDIMFGTGVSKIGDMIDLAVNKNIIAKAGAWFAYKDERIGQGRENAKEFLEQHPAMAAEIEKEVLAAYGVTGKGVEGSAEAAASTQPQLAAEGTTGQPLRAGAVAGPQGGKPLSVAPQGAGSGSGSGSAKDDPGAQAKAATVAAASKAKKPEAPAPRK
jgi:recombination protein RecA